MLRKYRIQLFCIILASSGLYWLISGSLSLLGTEDDDPAKLQYEVDRASAKLSRVLESRDAGFYLQLGNNTTLVQPAPAPTAPAAQTQQQHTGTRHLVTFLVPTLPNAVERRNTIRNTWKQWTCCNGNGTDDALLYFFIGLSGNLTLDAAVMAEAQLHNDIIVENVTEAYQRLVIKVLRLLKWFLINGSSQYVVKVDDDVFVHVPRIISYLADRSKLISVAAEEEKDYFIGGYVTKRLSSPIRDPFSKWFLPFSWYPEEYFPWYANGPIYIISRPTVPLLLNASLNIPLIAMEDAYLTGMVAKAIGMVPERIPGIVPQKQYKYINEEIVIYWDEYWSTYNLAWHPVKTDGFFYELYEYFKK